MSERRRGAVVLSRGRCGLVGCGGSTLICQQPGGEQLLLANTIRPLPSALDLTVYPAASSPSSTSRSFSAASSASSSSAGSRPTSPDLVDSGYSSGSQTSSSSPLKKATTLPCSMSADEDGFSGEVSLRRRRQARDPDLGPVGVDIEDGSKDADGPLLARADEGAGDEQDDTELKLRDATRNFFGGMNNHSGAAKEMMRTLRVAVLDSH